MGRWGSGGGAEGEPGVLHGKRAGGQTRVWSWVSKEGLGGAWESSRSFGWRRRGGAERPDPQAEGGCRGARSPG